MVAYIRRLVVDFWRGIKVLPRHYRWESLCLLAILAGYLVASIFEQTFFPSMSNLSMTRAMGIVFGAYAIRAARAVDQVAWEWSYQEGELPAAGLATGESYQA